MGARRKDRRARATGRSSSGERFAKLPREVLRSEAARTLPAGAARVLVALADQCVGPANNGGLTLPRSVARDYGLRSNRVLSAGLSELERRGLVVVTHHGGRGALGCSRYGLTWWPISPAVKPLHTWAKWSDNAACPSGGGEKGGPNGGPAWPQRGAKNGPTWPQRGAKNGQKLAPRWGPSKNLPRGRVSAAGFRVGTRAEREGWAGAWLAHVGELLAVRA